MPRLPLLALCTFAFQVAASELPSPSIARVFPLGGEQGTSVAIEISGEYLSNAADVEFDCEDLTWTRTVEARSGRLSGTVAIAPDASLGPHLLRVRTTEGYSPSALFNVGQFGDEVEVEPNDRLSGAQELSAFPVEVQGALEGAVDVDTYAINVREGERRAFEMRSIEYGSAVEAKMFLLDGDGRQVAFNDDRNDYLETPFVEHTFEKGGRYYLKIDQYRGPRGFNFGKSSTYTLRISDLPTIEYVSPLGAEVGRAARISLHGSGLGAVEDVYVTSLRGAEYARMTYPYTMPVHFREDPPTSGQVPRIGGSVVRRTENLVEAEFEFPKDADTGLWQVWAAGASGVADGPMIELSRMPAYDEATASDADWRAGGYAVDGSLEKAGERDVFAIHVIAGQPLQFWTLATQLGVPHLDSVLALRDADGKRLAENDDVVAGQGTLLGNPDSSLFYTPAQDGVLFLTVNDRTWRGGPSYRYRLKVRSERPGFQLFTTPENFTVPRGGEAEIKVHLVREEGFEGEVSVWFENMPPALDAPRGKFRADQLFVPNADGADMIIPEIAFRVAVPDSLLPGTYPIGIMGAPTAEGAGDSRRLVEARSTLIMGPLLDLWNFVRRPLPGVAITVVDPMEARLSATERSLQLVRGDSCTLNVTSKSLPPDAYVTVKGLPSGVDFRSIRKGNQFIVTLVSSSEASEGTFDISAESYANGRWISSRSVALTVKSNRAYSELMRSQ